MTWTMQNCSSAPANRIAVISLKVCRSKAAFFLWSRSQVRLCWVHPLTFEFHHTLVCRLVVAKLYHQSSNFASTDWSVYSRMWKFVKRMKKHASHWSLCYYLRNLNFSLSSYIIGLLEKYMNLSSSCKEDPICPIFVVCV